MFRHDYLSLNIHQFKLHKSCQIKCSDPVLGMIFYFPARVFHKSISHGKILNLCRKQTSPKWMYSPILCWEMGAWFCLELYNLNVVDILTSTKCSRTKSYPGRQKKRVESEKGAIIIRPFIQIQKGDVV